MAFISAKSLGYVHQAGQFLAHEECTRVTQTIPQSLATTVGTTKYVKSGTPFPANDATAIGLLYEDVDVTVGDMPGSVVTKGEVIEAKLPVTLESAAKTALQGLGFKFVTEGTITRPNWTNS